MGYGNHRCPCQQIPVYNRARSLVNWEIRWRLTNSSMRAVNPLYLHPLTPEWIPAAVELDQKFLGGLWSADGYQREIDSPNGLLLAISTPKDPRFLEETGDLSPIDEPDPRFFEKTGDLSLLGFGCLWMILDEAHITLLVVDAAYRRQGLGRALVTALLEAARQHGMARATLEVRASNEGAIALYQSFGFKEAGRRKQYYQNPTEDAHILWRSGLQSPDFAEDLRLWKDLIGDRVKWLGPQAVDA